MVFGWEYINRRNKEDLNVFNKLNTLIMENELK